MKRTALAILSSVVMASPAFALVGGPFDNNIFFGNDMNGTYQGVITGMNVSGIMVFGTTSGSQVGAGSASDLGIYGNGGRAALFVNGNLLTCDVSAVADYQGRSLTMSLSGSVGHGTTDTAQVIQVETIPKVTTVTTGTGADQVVTSGTTYTYVNTTTTYTLDGASQVSGILNSRFTKTFPHLEFSGEGDLQLLSSTDLSQSPPNTAPFVNTFSEDLPVRVFGVRTSNNNPFFVGTLTWNFPSVSTSTETSSTTPP